MTFSYFKKFIFFYLLIFILKIQACDHYGFYRINPANNKGKIQVFGHLIFKKYFGMHTGDYYKTCQEKINWKAAETMDRIQYYLFGKPLPSTNVYFDFEISGISCQSAKVVSILMITNNHSKEIRHFDKIDSFLDWIEPYCRIRGYVYLSLEELKSIDKLEAKFLILTASSLKFYGQIMCPRNFDGSTPYYEPYVSVNC